MVGGWWVGVDGQINGLLERGRVSSEMFSGDSQLKVFSVSGILLLLLILLNMKLGMAYKWWICILCWKLCCATYRFNEFKL